MDNQKSQSSNLRALFLLMMLVFFCEFQAFGFGEVFFSLNFPRPPPPNVTGLAALEDTTTSLLLFWTSGGGITSKFRLSYQSGSTAPSSCTVGTQVSESTIGAATNYFVTGLTANTLYSFRICAVSALGVKASGMTVTLKTPVSQPVFRSVGFNQTAAKSTGASNAMTITGGIASFATGLADNIGIGDAIQYSSSNGTIDRIAFVHGRISATRFLVKSATGTTPTNVGPITVWSLFRAYDSINNVIAGNENTGINSLVRNFDTSKNLTTFGSVGVTYIVAAYADAAHDTIFANIGSTWTTSVNNKFILMTPWESRHVAARQRHMGAWNTTYFHAVNTDDSVFEIDNANVVVEGLQLQTTLTVNDWIGPIGIGMSITPPTNSSIEINGNIIVVINNSPAARDVGGVWVNNPASGMKLYFTNNIVICVPGAGTVTNKECIRGVAASYTNNDTFNWTGYFYNNTIVGSWQYGIDMDQHGTGIKTAYMKNNLVQGALYYSLTATTYGTGTGYNISDNGVATGKTGDKVNTTVSFVNAAAKDYHLSAGDTAARDAGTNLSADVNYPVTMDIDSTPRTGTWDIGADSL